MGDNVAALANRAEMALNFDIFATISPLLLSPLSLGVKWYNQPHLLSLMHTCRTLYKVGLPIYLGQKIAITISQCSNSPGTMHFFRLFHDHPYRIHYLRDICLDIRLALGTDPSLLELIDALACVLSQAHNLKCLRIVSVGQLLQSSRFLSAISSLTKLEQLSITSQCLNAAALRLLASLQSPLSRIEVIRGGYPPSSAPWVNMDSILAFSHFRESLTDFRTTLPLLNDHARIQYPKVHTAVIDAHHGLHNLSFWFPNLQDLHLTVVGVDDKLLEARSNGLSSGSYVRGNEWAHLDKLHCTVRSAYALYMKGTVRWWNAGRVMARDKHMFHSLLDDFRSSHLQLSVETSGLSVEDFDDLLPHCSTVTHLEIKVGLSCCPVDGWDFVPKFTSWISNFPNLRVLHAEFTGVFAPPLFQDVVPSMLQDGHIQKLAQRLLFIESVFFAEYLSLHTREDHRGYSPRLLWEVSRPGLPCNLPLRRQSVSYDECVGISQGVFPYWLLS